MQLSRWLAAAVLLALFAGATRTSADPDLWGHVRFGLDALETHTLPSVDPYSFTQDRPWINHEWLSEVQMGGAYAALGPAGLALLKGAVALLAVYLIWGALRAIRFEGRLVGTAAAAIGAAQLATTLRPQLWSLVCVSVLCLVLSADSSKHHRWLPVLFIVWANLHGAWILGLGILALWLGVESVIERSAAIEALKTVCLCGLATLVTPYGAALWWFLYDTVRVTRPNIEEWQPLWTLGVDKWIPWAAAVATAFWASAKPFPRRWATMAVLWMLAYAAMRVARVGPFFVVSTVVLLAPWAARRWPARPVAVWGKDPLAERLLVTAVVAGAILGSAWLLPRNLGCIATTTATVPDSALLDALGQAPAGRLVTFFNWGELAIWHLGPRIRVSMDGRRETVYSGARIADHDAILFGTAAAWPVLESWRAEYVWLPSTSLATKQWLTSHGYRVDWDSPSSFLAVRGDLPRLKIGASSIPLRCFPD